MNSSNYFVNIQMCKLLSCFDLRNKLLSIQIDVIGLIVFPLSLLHYCYFFLSIYIFFLLICFCNTVRIYGHANKAYCCCCCCCCCPGHTIRELLSSNTHLATMRVLTVLRHWVTKHPEVSVEYVCYGVCYLH